MRRRPNHPLRKVFVRSFASTASIGRQSYHGGGDRERGCALEATELEETNARFYRAVEGRDLGAMEALWLHAEYVRCIHPGWCLLSGWDAVRQSWEAIFKDSRELRFTLSDVQIQVEGGLAWVTATENILSQSQGNISVTAVLATNVYERRGTRWRMVLHHASHILTGQPEGEGRGERAKDS